MKYLIITIITFFLIFNAAIAQSQIPKLLINEVQLGDEQSGTNEFVEIVNHNYDNQSLDNLALQYKSATGTNWSTKAILEGEIGPYGRILISNYLSEYSFEFNGGLSGTAGHLRLVSESTEIDRVAWGSSADSAETSPVESHGKGQNMKRRVDEDGRFIDRNNNSTDWYISNNPTPEFDHLISLEDYLVPEPAPIPTQPSPAKPIEEEFVPENPTHQIWISEIMPDPVSPLTDAEHEFVELHNPNNHNVNLAGYTLESGSEWRYDFTLGSYNLKPNERIAIFSADSNLTLSNSGTSVRLLGPNGQVLDQQTYEKFKSGWSWSKYSAGWQWAVPSPNTANSQTTYATEQASDKPDNEEERSEVLGTRNVDFDNPASSNKAASSSDQKTASFTEEEPDQSINSLVLAAFAIFALLYAAYEYRDEARIRIKQFRRYREDRRENRSEFAWRRNNRIAQRYRRWQDNIYTWFGKWGRQ